MGVMSPSEAIKLGIDEKDRGFYVQLKSAKGNLSAPSSEHRWFKRESVRLPNQGPIGDGGDEVGVLVPVDLKEHEEAVQARCDDIRTQLEDPSISEYDADLLKYRLAKLSGGVAIVRVGGSTEVELKQRKDRVEDALCATQAAVEAGITVGGGVALVRASSDLEAPAASSDSFKAGVRIIKKACESPLRRIASNADFAPDLVMHKIGQSINENHGFNADTGEYGDMIKEGIIDPIKVPKAALQNAASVAGLMLTIDCAVVEEDPDVMSVQIREASVPFALPCRQSL